MQRKEKEKEKDEHRKEGGGTCGEMGWEVKRKEQGGNGRLVTRKEVQ